MSSAFLSVMDLAPVLVVSKFGQSYALVRNAFLAKAKYMLKVPVSILVSVLVLSVSASALADLQAVPARIVLTETNSTAQISIREKGDKPVRYRIEVAYYKMKKDGSIEQIPDPILGFRSAADYFRFSPHQITLEPNVEQIVRLQIKLPEIKLPAKLEDADYLAQINFETTDEGDPKALVSGPGASVIEALRAEPSIAASAPVDVPAATVASAAVSPTAEAKAAVTEISADTVTAAGPAPASVSDPLVVPAVPSSNPPAVTSSVTSSGSPSSTSTPTPSPTPGPTPTPTPAATPVPIPMKTVDPQASLKVHTVRSVPVIVRKGNPTAKFSLEDLKLEKQKDGTAGYSVEVVKVGNAVMYADFFLIYTAFAPDSKPIIISQANGVPSYIDRRTVSYPINIPLVEKGTLTLEVREPVPEGGKVLASTTLDVK